MCAPSFIDVNTLSGWLESGREVIVVDLRPKEQREEWKIPRSIYVDAYKRLNEGDSSVLDDLSIPQNVPVVTVCAAGKTSQIAASELRKKGMEAYSLEGGMKGWSLAWNKAVLSSDGYTLIQLRRTGKGCLSYIINSGSEAIIIDASLPIEVYENILLENKWTLTAVMETHIHADHLSRSKQLADHLNVPLLLPAPNRVTFPHKEIAEGQEIKVGNVPIKVISTPGHTIESVCLLVNDEALFTGDTIFTNAVGRPDLKANEEEGSIRAARLYDSLQSLIQLGDAITVFPAHTNTPTDFDGKAVTATIAEIKKSIPLLKLSKNDFIKTILDKLPPPPANHLAIVERNLYGDLSHINPVDLEVGANRCAVSQ